MAVHERNRAARMYHGFISIVLLIAGGGLLGTGIWLRVTDNVGPLDLEYSGSNVFNWVLNFSTVIMVLGVFLIVAAIAAILALARKCLGATFRLVYIIMGLIIFLALGFIMVVSILILRNDDSDVVEDFVSQAWDRTVLVNSAEICSLEKHYECRGFNDNDCVDCRLGTETTCGAKSCARCNREAADVSKGCYDEIVDSIHKFYLPASIVSGLLAFVVLVDLIVACTL